MPWREYYKVLSFSFYEFLLFISKLNYTEIEKSYLKKMSIPFFIFSFAVICENYIINRNNSSVIIIYLVILLLLIFFFSYFTHKLKFYFMYRISEVLISKNAYNISFNQIKTYKFYKDENKNKDNFLLFFVTFHKNKCLKEKNKKLFAFLNASKEGIEILKKYKRNRYHFLLISNLFIMTFMLFWGLLFVIDNVENIKHNNIVFLSSVIFLIAFLIISYRSISQEHLNRYYKQAKEKLEKKYNCKQSIKIYTTKQEESVLSKNKSNKFIEVDIIGLVFGVLFTLYVTLLYNKLYVTAVDVNTVIDKNITKKIEFKLR